MISPLDPPTRVLMGPGPSDVSPAVLQAMARPTIGHLDPAFLQLMDEIRGMLRTLFGTSNEVTMPMSGTGSAGMETCLTNLIEPGDRVIIGVHGVFGGRMAEVARRCGAEVVTVEAPWGKALDPNDFRGKGRAKLLCLVHAETSTGVLQDLSPFRGIADELGALLVTDMVTSLAGVRTDLDTFGVDAAYSGTQKCLSCPPGLSPISFSERAVDALKARKAPVQSWYLDLTLIGRYWGDERAYHHTAPINQLYGLHEALRQAVGEGLEARVERHAKNAADLRAGLRELGLTLPVAEENLLPPLTLVELGEDVDDTQVRRRLLAEYGLEIGGGLGAFKGKAWRIGLMGASSTPRHVALCLAALRAVLRAS
ncbi:MAG: alanine--glyoxylate aminotransferase family protein [Myxococcota bacterium]